MAKTLEDFKKGDIVYYFGDVECEITKVCAKTIKISSYYFTNKLVYPHQIYKKKCVPKILTDMLKCQNHRKH